MLKIKHTRTFQKDIKRAKKRGKSLDKLCNITELLIMQQRLNPNHRDHPLAGNYKGYRECHIEPDWLLIYKMGDDTIIFERTGTHSDLFK